MLPKILLSMTKHLFDRELSFGHVPLAPCSRDKLFVLFCFSRHMYYISMYSLYYVQVYTVYTVANSCSFVYGQQLGTRREYIVRHVASVLQVIAIGRCCRGVCK